MRKLIYLLAAATVSTYADLAVAGKPHKPVYPNIVKPNVQFGTYGFKPGEFNEPTAAAISAEREIFIADCSNRRIQVFDFQGRFIREFGSNLSNSLTCPQGITLDEDRVYVSDAKHAIYVFEVSSIGV